MFLTWVYYMKQVLQLESLSFRYVVNQNYGPQVDSIDLNPWDYEYITLHGKVHIKMYWN